MNEYKDTDTDWVVEAQNGDSAKWSYVPGLARIAGGDPSSGAYQYQLRDRLGSVRDIRSQAKARLAEYTFEPYGDVWSSSGLALNQGFTGHTWDAALGMYHTAYRHYSPGMARWISRDPLGMVDGPNLYGYVGGDPVNGVDPDGLSILPLVAVCVTGIIAVGIAVWSTTLPITQNLPDLSGEGIPPYDGVPNNVFEDIMNICDYGHPLDPRMEQKGRSWEWEDNDGRLEKYWDDRGHNRRRPPHIDWIHRDNKDGEFTKWQVYPDGRCEREF